MLARRQAVISSQEVPHEAFPLIFPPHPLRVGLMTAGVPAHADTLTFSSIGTFFGNGSGTITAVPD